MPGRSTANVARANAARSALLASRTGAVVTASGLGCGDRVRLSEHGRTVFRHRPPDRCGVVTAIRRSGRLISILWDGLRSVEEMHVNYIEAAQNG